MCSDHEIQVGGHPCPIQRCGWPRDTGPRGGGTSDTTTTVPSLTHGQRKRLKVVADNIARPRAGGAGHGGVSGEAHTRCDDEVLDRRGGVGTYAVLELVLRGQLGSPSERSISAPATILSVASTSTAATQVFRGCFAIGNGPRGKHGSGKRVCSRLQDFFPFLG
jgi:hypothetical protein